MTPQQSKLYRFLLDRPDDAVAPTYSEMADHLGLAAKSGVVRIIDRLEELGKVRRDRSRMRSVRAIRLNKLHGISSAELIQELKNRGEWPNGR